jgi:predicted RNA-binding protein with PUA-like domain
MGLGPSGLRPRSLFPPASFCLNIYSMPNHYLLKTEPSEYSFADLKRDKKTVWDGVHNPVALRNLAEMKPGDRLIIYETGDRKAAVGTASVVSIKVTDRKNPQMELAAGKELARPTILAEIKANKLFAASPLVRMGRLSVVPLTAEQYEFITGD